MRISLNLVITAAAALPLLLTAQTVEHPLAIGGKVKPPLVVKKPEPEAGSPQSHTTRTETLVSVVIDETGRVSRAQLRHASGDADRDQKALRIARDYLFKPATLNDQPVAVWMVIAIDFSTSSP